MFPTNGVGEPTSTVSKMVFATPILTLMFSPSSKARLTEHDLERFQGETLFDRIARATCEAGCLPRKELYEAWEVARRVRRVFRGGRIIDLAAGHGLLAQILLIMDDSSRAAVAVDQAFRHLAPGCTTRWRGRGRNCDRASRLKRVRSIRWSFMQTTWWFELCVRRANGPGDRSGHRRWRTTRGASVLSRFQGE